MRKQALLLAGCAFAVLSTSLFLMGDASACLHAGRRAADPPVPVTQRGQQAIIVHHDGCGVLSAFPSVCVADES